MNKLLVILGPTATGKTDLAISIGRKISGELISADSRQVYKSLDIGSGKLPNKYESLERNDNYWIVDGVKVWGYDVAFPGEIYNAYQNTKFSKDVIAKIIGEDKKPIIVGGTGLYIKSLLYGLDIYDEKIDFEKREELEDLGLSDLRKKVIELFPEDFKKLTESDKNNKRRLVRVLEKGSFEKLGREEGIAQEFDILIIGLFAELDVLKERIRERVVKRMKQGMVGEVRSLVKKGLSVKRLKSLGLEYSIIADFIEGNINTENELIDVLSLRIGQFAKRQMTWFRKQPGIKWFNLSDANFRLEVEKYILDWYNDAK